MDITIRPVRRGDIYSMTRVILAARGFAGAELGQQVERDLTRFREQGLVDLIERDALVALDGGKMIGVMRYGEFDQNVDLSKPDIDPQVEAEPVVNALLQAFWTHISPQVKKAIYVDYHEQAGAYGDLFVANGFELWVERTDLRLRLTEPMAKGTGRLTFHSYSQETHARFLHAFIRSFEGSLDPMMEWDAKHPQESFLMFRDRFGEFDPQLWVLATDEQGNDVGFALFKYFAGGRYAGDMMLLYMAVMPENRGQGYGEDILREGLRRIRDVRGPQATVSLTVSGPNLPAAEIYRRLGFQKVEEFAVYRMART